MDDNNWLGRVVYSKAGRDKDKYFIVLKKIDDNYVYIADGTLRLIGKPKKKKIKHLIVTDIISNGLKESLKSNKQITDSMIKKCLQEKIPNKEV